MFEERSEASRRIWIVAIFLFVFGDGLTIQTRGALLRSFEAEFSISEGFLGLVSPAGTAGFIAAVLVVGLLAGRLSIKRWIMGGVACTAVALLLMSGAPVYWLFLLVLFGQGTAAGVVRGLDRVVLSHLYPHNRGRIFTLHSLAWSTGAALGPIYVNQMLALGNWRLTYLSMAGFFAPLGFLLWCVEMPGDVEDEQAISIGKLVTLIQRPVVMLTVGIIFIVGSTEGIIFTWLPFWASEFVAESTANLLLTLFLLAYLPARVIYSSLVGRFSALSIATVASLGFLPAFIVMVSGIKGPVLYTAIFTTGFCVAGFFPLVSAIGVNAAPEYSGPVSAVATGGAYVGIALGPIVVGGLAELLGIHRAMQLTAVLPLLAMISILFTAIVGTERLQHH